MRIRVLPVLVLIAVTFASCDDEIFGPRSLEGTWRVTEESEAFGSQTFLVGIDYYPGDDSRIIIGNFSNLDLRAEVIADVVGLSLTIEHQTVQSRGGTFRVSGSGAATSNMRRINWNYRVDGEDYTAVFNKQ
ncbi:MAG: hypothetical protein EA408_00615 [Marinilabiliales bacterium]|nr:MAG: hypothetical protein EA408_00615 [Marinilabiliales bacterium]